MPVNGTDTFAVSTSWLKPTGTANNWLITPTINNITANSVLTWEAMAPDLNNQDGYEVYVTTNTLSTPLVTDFSAPIFTTIAEKVLGKHMVYPYQHMPVKTLELHLKIIQTTNINCG